MMIKRIISKWLDVDHLKTELSRTRMELQTVKERYARMEKTWSDATAEIQDISTRHDDTRIVVASKLGRGFCRFYELKFNSITELNDFCEVLARREVSSSRPMIDAPFDLNNMNDRDRKKRGLKPRWTE